MEWIEFVAAVLTVLTIVFVITIAYVRSRLNALEDMKRVDAARDSDTARQLREIYHALTTPIEGRSVIVPMRAVILATARQVREDDALAKKKIEAKPEYGALRPSITEILQAEDAVSGAPDRPEIASVCPFDCYEHQQIGYCYHSAEYSKQSGGDGSE